MPVNQPHNASGSAQGQLLSLALRGESPETPKLVQCNMDGIAEEGLVREPYRKTDCVLPRQVWDMWAVTVRSRSQEDEVEPDRLLVK